MKQIMTVCGPMAPKDLGFTSMHDHILADVSFFHRPAAHAGGPLPFDPDAPIALENLGALHSGLQAYCRDNWDLTNVDLMQREVQLFREGGGQTILEPSAPGLRHNVVGLRTIAQATGVNIIASTGLYREETWPERYRAMSVADYQACMQGEIDNGIGDTGVFPGHIKTAISKGTENEFRFVESVAPVANASGLLVTAHTSYRTAPEKRSRMLKTFLDTGMNPEKLLFCHAQFTFAQPDTNAFLRNREVCRLDLRWCREVLDAGANLCVDLFGFGQDNETMAYFGRTDAVKMAGLAALLDAGFADRVVIGNDVYQKIMTRSCGGHGYCRILEFTVPALLDNGYGQDVVDQITVINPARLLQY